MSGLIIVGSSRADSQSEKVARYINSILPSAYSGQVIHTIFTRDLGVMHWGSQIDFSKTEAYESLQQQLQAASYFVVITPEWDGMVPPSLKNFFLIAGTAMAHKPALIVAISAGLGGSYPVAELRMSSYKNSKVCYIPDHLIIREVGSVLNAEDPENEADIKTRERLIHSLKLLWLYADALSHIRSSDEMDLGKYMYGM